MNNFPIEKLMPSYASFCESWGPLNLPSITIELMPFTLEDEQVETSIRLDHIPLPCPTLKALSGKTFHFPSNPEAGYIDGSIYLFSRHQMVDVHTLNFGSIDHDRNQLSLTLAACLSIQDMDAVLHTHHLTLTTLLDLPFSAEQLLLAATEAIKYTQATTPKDIGCVMQYLKQQKRYDNDMQELHQHICKYLLKI